MQEISIISSQKAFYILKNLMDSEVEEFWVMALNSKKQIIESKMIFRGTVDRCVIHPRDIFRFALLKNASSILIAHNHPSGDCYPSLEDIQITEDIFEISKLIQIPVVDHIVIATNGYYSFKDSGRLLL